MTAYVCPALSDDQDFLIYVKENILTRMNVKRNVVIKSSKNI